MVDPEERFARKYPEVAAAEVDNELANRYTSHPATKDQIELYDRIRAWGLDGARMLAAYCPASRELSLAQTNLDDAVMHANAAIARHR